MAAAGEEEKQEWGRKIPLREIEGGHSLVKEAAAKLWTHFKKPYEGAENHLNDILLQALLAQPSPMQPRENEKGENFCSFILHKEKKTVFGVE
jgi:hypothetical protein